MPVFFSGDSSAQKGAFIKMKQENIYTYQRLFVLCCVVFLLSHQYFQIVILYSSKLHSPLVLYL
ncbi:hypothetical protein DMO59_03700 [Salmonella enterica subsp. diarizonae]|nr:hypothetical protein [Salmonella enterica]ECE1090067.1 hypothetical protein [Salmonella enterica subsp. diarizonae]EGE5262184.1 hypothetical protein [Salmonella enterica subsp. diarizonae serovar 38:k:z]ECJ4480205.1 hypothetical protein [Salmonella enterica subsp. diarizonae]EDV3182868.1 hypothetical protein [Salmonella enterica subsp. diarizonae]